MAEKSHCLHSQVEASGSQHLEGALCAARTNDLTAAQPSLNASSAIKYFAIDLDTRRTNTANMPTIKRSHRSMQETRCRFSVDQFV